MSKIVYKSEVMNQLMRMVKRVAPSSANVLLLGEVGTGQSLIATEIHNESNRKLKPLVSLNCGALRETLLESELFGHEKGAFTGAYSRKIGLLEVASGGTMLLEEVDQLSPGMQAKLLRFLQEGEIYRVGGKDPIRVDVRIITSTTKELDKEVLRGNFREDLFYRINTIMIHIPPLRRRKEDILELARSFSSFTFSVPVINALTSYPWPGNVRELKNTIERLTILTDGPTIQLQDLPEHIKNPDASTVDTDTYDPSLTLYDLEKRYVLKALAHFDGNKTQAANALGITIKTLYNKLHEYGEFEKYAVKS
jgi:transcriptional regulator with PAS, ATPase and Fis domain